jgi:hypothetical protein
MPWWGLKSPPIRLYKRPPHRGEFDTSGLREFLEEISSPLPYAPPLFLFPTSSSPLFGVVPASSRILLIPNAVRQPDSPVQILLLPLHWWTGSGRSHGAPYVWEYYDVLHVRHYVVAPVSSHRRHGVRRHGIDTSSSSWPWGRLRRLHQ